MANSTNGECANGTTGSNTTLTNSKKRGRPRLYEVNPNTGKSIKGRLITNGPGQTNNLTASNSNAKKPLPPVTQAIQNAGTNFILSKPSNSNHQLPATAQLPQHTSAMPIHLSNGFTLYHTPTASSSPYPNTHQPTTIFINGAHLAAANHTNNQILINHQTQQHQPTAYNISFTDQSHAQPNQLAINMPATNLDRKGVDLNTKSDQEQSEKESSDADGVSNSEAESNNNNNNDDDAEMNEPDDEENKRQQQQPATNQNSDELTKSLNINKNSSLNSSCKSNNKENAVNTSSNERDTTRPNLNEINNNKDVASVKPIKAKSLSLKPNTVLTHVIDGFILKESSKPFPVKSVNGVAQQIEPHDNDSTVLNNDSTPPKSTSTPFNGNKKDLDEEDIQQSSSSKRTAKRNNKKARLNESLSNNLANEENPTGEDELLCNSRLLEDSLNTSRNSVKSSSKQSKSHNHHKHNHKRHRCKSQNQDHTDINSSSSAKSNEIDPQSYRLNNFTTSHNGDEQMDTSSASLLLPPPPPPPPPQSIPTFISTQFSPQSAVPYSFQSSPQVCFLTNAQSSSTPPPILNTSNDQFPSGDPTEWNCDEVHQFVKCVAGAQVAQLFKDQDMDGYALNLIRDDHLVSTMQIKLGPALKIMNKFNELKSKHTRQQHQQHSQQLQH